MIQTAHAALENVDMMASPYKLHRQILSLSGLFLKHKTKNNGQSAIKKNHRLMGLSKRNWLRAYPLSNCV
jgi:hypothetical protein